MSVRRPPWVRQLTTAQTLILILYEVDTAKIPALEGGDFLPPRDEAPTDLDDE